MAGRGIFISPQRNVLPPPDFYRRAGVDTQKPYPIGVTVLGSGRQSEKTYLNPLYDSKDPYKGGYYTKKLVEGLGSSDSFVASHQKLEKQGWTNEYKLAQQEKKVAEKWSDYYSGERHKIVSQLPEYKQQVELEAQYKKQDEMLRKEMTAIGKQLAGKDDPKLQQAMDDIRQQRGKLSQRFETKHSELEQSIRSNPDVKASQEKFRKDVAPLQEQQNVLQEKRTIKGTDTEDPLPVSSAKLGVEGWKKNDTNPRTALLIQGNGRGITDDSVNLMKEALMKHHGLQEKDIHIARNQEEIQEKMAAMKKFGQDNAGKKPAAMIYFNGHSAIDGNAKYDPSSPSPITSGIPRDKPEGELRGMMQVPLDKTAQKEDRENFLHEYQLKDLMEKNMGDFDNRTLMIMDTCFPGSLTAKADDTQTLVPVQTADTNGTEENRTLAEPVAMAEGQDAPESQEEPPPRQAASAEPEKQPEVQAG